MSNVMELVLCGGNTDFDAFRSRSSQSTLSTHVEPHRNGSSGDVSEGVPTYGYAWPRVAPKRFLACRFGQCGTPGDSLQAPATAAGKEYVMPRGTPRKKGAAKRQAPASDLRRAFATFNQDQDGELSHSELLPPGPEALTSPVVRLRSLGGVRLTINEQQQLHSAANTSNAQRQRGEAAQILVRHRRTSSVDGVLLQAPALDLKRRIACKLGVPIDTQSITFAGKLLDDELDLTFYGMTDGSTIHLSFRGRGGGCCQSKALPSSSADSPENILGSTQRARSPVKMGTSSGDAVVVAESIDVEAEDTTALALPEDVRRALTAFDDRLVEALAASVIRLVSSSWLLAQLAGFQLPYRQQLEELERDGASPSPLVSPEEAVALVRQGNRSVGSVTQ